MKTLLIVLRSPLVLFVVLSAPLFAQIDTTWMRRYDGGQRDEDWVSDMVVDRAGYIYLAGSAATVNISPDIIVQKYAPNGMRQWAAVYNGTSNDEDSASALVVDDSGNVYVCGWSTETGQAAQMLLMKLAPNGTRLWSKTYGRRAGAADGALGLCLDRAGRVIVTGYSTDTSGLNIDYCTISYKQSNGDTNWVRFYNKTPENDEDVAVSVCVDATNNIYITGYSYSDNTEYDIVTIRYTSAGARSWVRRFSTAPVDDDDFAVAIAYNQLSQTVAVTGTMYYDNKDFDIVTIGYSANVAGDELWSRDYNNYPYDREDVPTSLLVDRQGRMYVTGTVEANAGIYDAVTLCYDRTGFPLWAAKYDYDGLDDVASHLTVDSLGNVFCIGTSETDNADMDIMILKYDSAGAQLWDYLYNNRAENDADWGARIATRPDGGIIVSGSSYYDSTDTDFVLFRFIEVYRDMAVFRIIAPDSLLVQDSIIPRAVVANQSTTPESCWIRLRTNLGPYLESTWVSLAAGESATVTFRVWRPETTGIANILCWSTLWGEMRPQNDSAWARVVVWDETTGIGARPAVVVRPDLELLPNPAPGAVMLRVTLPDGATGRVRIYDPTGARALAEREVRTTANGTAGERFDLSRLAAGVYFVRLEFDSRTISRKLVLHR